MSRLSLIFATVMMLILSGWWLVQPATAAPTATTWYVSNSGSDPTPPYLLPVCTVLAPCATIGFANSLASDGDTLALMGGSYTENVTVTQDITLQGVQFFGVGWSNCFVACATIDVANSLPALSGSDLSLTINHVIFDGAAGDDATNAGIELSGGQLALNSVVMRNLDGEFGGALRMGTSTGGGDSMTISNSSFTGNSAETGGAIYAYDVATVTVENSLFADNSATGSSTINTSLGGGAIHVRSISNTVISIDGTLFENNSAGRGGAALIERGALFSTSTGQITIKLNHTAFQTNTATSTGGAIWIDRAQTVALDGTAFENNNANQAGAAYFGNVFAATVHNTTFRDNRANSGGAMASSSTSLGTYGGVIISDTVFSDNVAFDRSGALTASAVDLTLTGMTQFIGNAAGRYAGALYYRQGSLIVDGAQFVNNSVEYVCGTVGLSDYARGGAIVVSSDISAEIRNTQFMSNTVVAFGNDCSRPATGSAISVGRLIGSGTPTLDNAFLNAHDAFGLSVDSNFTLNLVDTIATDTGIYSEGTVNLLRSQVSSTETGAATLTTATCDSEFTIDQSTVLHTGAVNSEVLIDLQTDCDGVFSSRDDNAIHNSTLACQGDCTALRGGDHDSALNFVTVRGSLVPDAAQFTLQGSIIDGACDDPNTAIVFAGDNLATRISCAPGATIATQTLSSPLTDSGNGIMIHPLLPNTPAIDVVGSLFCQSTPINGIDQIGVQRPVGSACDLGAVEYTGVPTAVSYRQSANSHQQTAFRRFLIFTGSLLISSLIVMPGCLPARQQ